MYRKFAERRHVTRRRVKYSSDARYTGIANSAVLAVFCVLVATSQLLHFLQWLRWLLGTVVERLSVTGELSLSYARPGKPSATRSANYANSTFHPFEVD